MLVLSVVIALASSNFIGGLALGEAGKLFAPCRLTIISSIGYYYVIVHDSTVYA